MSKTYAVHVCSFEAVEVTSRTTYAQLKAAALKAGRFSVFEACATPRATRMFTRLCKDPDVVTTKDAFPWTNVHALVKAVRVGDRFETKHDDRIEVATVTAFDPKENLPVSYEYERGVGACKLQCVLRLLPRPTKRRTGRKHDDR